MRTRKVKEAGQARLTPHTERFAFQLSRIALGKLTLREHCVEFFPLLKGYEERERFAVSCYGSLQTVERGRIFGCSASCYLGVRRQFEHAFYDLSCMTRTRLSHGPGLPISVVQLHPRADSVISRAVSHSQGKPILSLKWDSRIAQRFRSTQGRWVCGLQVREDNAE